MKTMKLALVAGLFGMMATPALAIFDAQVMVGKRWYDVDGEGTSAQEVGLAAHIDPIPMVPVAFGASVAMIEMNKKDFVDEPDTAKIFEPAIEVMAWLPMVPVITPYARVKIPVMATYILENDDDKIAGKLSGYHLNAGIKWSPLPIVKLLLEAGMSSETLAYEDVEIAGVEVDSPDDEDIKSNAFLVGVEIGL